MTRSMSLKSAIITSFAIVSMFSAGITAASDCSSCGSCSAEPPAKKTVSEKKISPEGRLNIVKDEKIKSVIEKVVDGQKDEALKLAKQYWEDNTDKIEAERLVAAVKNDCPVVAIETNKGVILVSLLEDAAPNTVANFIELTKKGYYNGIAFHRVIPDFMIQGGDPTGTGSGGPGYKFDDEFSSEKHERGTLSMANAGPKTNGSQFFITHVVTQWLDGKHTVFGRVIEGQDVVDSISKGDKMENVDILWARDHEYKVKTL